MVDQRGLSAFDLLRSWRHDRAAVLCAFDLIELDGKDLRHAPLLSSPMASKTSVQRSLLCSESSCMTFPDGDREGASLAAL